jgi:hypothetical protein
MENYKYRIKIKTRNDGQTWYVPQVKKKWYHLKWENIISSRSYGYLTIETSRSTTVSYAIHFQAEEAIEDYKKYVSDKWKSKTKNVKYEYK